MKKIARRKKVKAMKKTFAILVIAIIIISFVGSLAFFGF